MSRTKGQWELFDLRSDLAELGNLYGEPGQEAVSAELKATLLAMNPPIRGSRPCRSSRS